MPRARLGSSLFVALVGAMPAACGDECPIDALPGICSGRQNIVGLGHELDDGVLVDIDGDGEAELIGVVWGGIRVAWGDGRLVVPRGVGESVASVASGDLNGDGHEDVAFLADRTSKLYLEEIDAAGEFTEIEVIDVGGGPVGLRASDLDGDGRVELVTADRDGDALVTVHGGDHRIDRIPVGIAPGAFELADLDGDGAFDLLVADFLRAEILVLQGRGDGSFAEPVATPSALGLDSIAVGDVDGDGAVDVATRGAGAEIWVHPGDGSGGLGQAVVIDVVDAEGRDRGLAIMPPGTDGVGGVLAPESAGVSTWLLGPGQSSIGRARRAGASRLRRHGPGSWLAFGARADLLEVAEGPLPVERWRHRVGDPVREQSGPVTLIDYDSDGDLDVIAAFTAPDPTHPDLLDVTAEIFLGHGDGTLMSSGDRPLGSADILVCADVDGDGTLDLVSDDDEGALYLWAGSADLNFPDGQLVSPVHRLLAPLRGATRTRLVVGERVYEASDIGSRPQLALLTIDGQGRIHDSTILAPGVEILAIRVGDLDGDGDDDLILLGRAEGRRVLRAWIVDGDELSAGELHVLEDIVGWDEATPLSGLGVGDLGTDGEVELLLGSPLGLARIQGIEGPTPTVVIDDARLPVIAAASPIECCDELPRLVVGDLDGDGERDLLRCGDACDVIRGDGGPLGGEPEEVPLPTGRVVPAEFDGDGRIDFVVDDPGGFGVMIAETHAGPRSVRSWPGLAAASSIPLIGDLDGDGRREIVVPAAGGVAMVRDVGQPGARIEALVGGPDPKVAAIADLDGDGRDEVVFGPTSEGLLGALRWDGARLRVDPLSAPGIRAERMLTIEDLDGDGVLDLVAHRDHPFEVELAYGIDASTFDAPVSLGIPPVLDVQVVDLNDDGRPDILGSGGDGVVILWNRPGRTWGRTSIEPGTPVVRDGDLFVARGDHLYRVPIAGETVSRPLRAAMSPDFKDAGLISGGDLDGDGRDDLISVQASHRTLWLSRYGGFLRALEFSSPYGVPVIADLDGGGLAELVAVNDQGIHILWGEARE